jgi:hypothetical protein
MSSVLLDIIAIIATIVAFGIFVAFSEGCQRL